MEDNKFPWEILKADSLRLVCHQLFSSSQAGNPLGRREEMIAFLRDVNIRGLDVALKAAAETKLAQDVLNDAPNGAKRSAEDEDEDEDADADADEDAHGEIDEEEELIVMSSNLAYNTRFKGVKRVKMEREGPEVVDRPPQRRRGRPRKSAPAALIETGTKKSGSTAAAAQASGSMVDPQQPVKRGRGRPRKNPIPPAPETPHKSSPTNSPSSKKSGGPPDSRGRQIFDGVVLPQRPKKALVPVSLSGLGPDHHDPDADADGDMDAEAEAEVEEGAWVHSSTVQNSELAGTEQGNETILQIVVETQTFSSS